jgi:hypothetical protein
VTTDAELIQAVVVILRGGLDHMQLSRSIPDDDLRPHATLLFKRIRADESEPMLRKTVADIQAALGLAVNDHRCRDVVSRASALVKNN